MYLFYETQDYFMRPREFQELNKGCSTISTWLDFSCLPCIKSYLKVTVKTTLTQPLECGSSRISDQLLSKSLPSLLLTDWKSSIAFSTSDVPQSSRTTVLASSNLPAWTEIKRLLMGRQVYRLLGREIIVLPCIASVDYPQQTAYLVQQKHQGCLQYRE